MATPLASFHLDRSVFNETLYSRLNDFWFQGVSKTDTAPAKDTLMRWYGIGSSESKLAFDKACAAVASNALDSISPDKLSLPPFKSHEDELEKAGELSAPLLEEVKQSDNPADVILALTLLLDQMPRNIFREQHTLPKVYEHYDRLALALTRTSLGTMHDPFAPYSGRPVVRAWYYMPLMHSEDISAHEQWRALTAQDRKVCADAGDDAACGMIDAGIAAEIKHYEPLEKFGRYPHRNECLGRENTSQEDKYMETADTFGVKQNTKTESKKDEL